MSDNLIRRARRNMRGHWHQGSLRSADLSRMCALAHLRAESGDAINVLGPSGFESLEVLSTFGPLNDAARDKFPDRITGLSSPQAFVDVNDHPDTTEEDMLLVFDLAADRLDLERGEQNG